MVKILDCTIRDGGYANEWTFSDECFVQTFIAAQKSGIDYFEAGYRNKNGKTKYNCILDKDIEPLVECKNTNIKLFVMVNDLEYDPSLFPMAERSLVDGVRVACHVSELELGIHISEELYDKGYEVFLNIMNIPQISREHFDILAKWGRKCTLTSVCFADSYGVLFPQDIPEDDNTFKDLGFENISLHTHNNLQMAFANTLAAIDCGAYCVDGTVYGMGRGGGNLPLELIIGYLKKHSPEFYIDLIEKYYLPIYKKHDWGYSVPALISALKDVHPNKTHDNEMSFVEMWHTIGR